MSPIASIVFISLAICVIGTASNKTSGWAVSGELNCPPGWSFSEGAKRCYKVNNDLITWEEAQARCESFNATLATIPNRETEEALRNYTYVYVNEDVFHIGLRYIPGITGEWVWLDGTKANYTHWYTAPNPAFGECAQASLERDGGRWYPEPCGVVKRPSVCELPLSSDGKASETGPKYECKDAVSSWKCASLKSLQACSAAQYIKFVQKNCAKTCGFCQ
ncbi:antifreeze protein [Aphelenchoides avenae]|nr:antifreeze protein [Aphelenchus avenae]